MLNLFGLRKKRAPVDSGTASQTGSHSAVRVYGATGRQRVLNPEAARVASLLENPDLALQTEEGVDPYNSGLFDRTESWSRVNKRS